ncbi:peptidylprolyl isomerase [Nitrosomonas sp. Is35]|uniref:peptidylprolyl isomerase n=1 Tax=Nitrosomonas sp. Is35 TaxID=3080534 RepID=UPI00294B8000|nr:peptidylprolyl isomerase [Nitrosomonas sp. Is35]MDV6346627.1 peptidylprolyl isomerase [Nitrosomonas sp. Is35]
MAQANSVACFTSSMGQFCIELFETQTPITTANFLKYIDSDAYTNGIFHRSIPGFVIQGGGFKVVDGTSGESLVAVNTFSPIINEFKISNTRGTVAMAKLGGNPNSATSQWFVNLADNSANLDYQNGGFTVFGRVIFDGMTVFDAIAKLPVRNLGGSLTNAPLKDFDGVHAALSNLVKIDRVEVTDATGIFSDSNLSFAVDIGTGQMYHVSLQLVSDNPSYVFQLDPASVVPLSVSPGNIATLSNSTSQLQIPSVMIGASSVVKNVVLQLTDAELYKFTLLSFE